VPVQFLHDLARGHGGGRNFDLVRHGCAHEDMGWNDVSPACLAAT
jgi:hypothetical protein